MPTAAEGARGARDSRLGRPRCGYARRPRGWPGACSPPARFRIPTLSARRRPGSGGRKRIPNGEEAGKRTRSRAARRSAESRLVRTRPRASGAERADGGGGTCGGPVVTVAGTGRGSSLRAAPLVAAGVLERGGLRRPREAPPAPPARVGSGWPGPRRSSGRSTCGKALSSSDAQCCVQVLLLRFRL